MHLGRFRLFSRNQYIRYVIETTFLVETLFIMFRSVSVSTVHFDFSFIVKMSVAGIALLMC